jgi:hypothetical protein
MNSELQEQLIRRARILLNKSHKADTEKIVQMELCKMFLVLHAQGKTPEQIAPELLASRGLTPEKIAEKLQAAIATVKGWIKVHQLGKFKSEVDNYSVPQNDEQWEELVEQILDEDNFPEEFNLPDDIDKQDVRKLVFESIRPTWEREHPPHVKTDRSRRNRPTGQSRLTMLNPPRPMTTCCRFLNYPATWLTNGAGRGDLRRKAARLGL